MQACQGSAKDNSIFSSGVLTIDDNFKSLSVLNEDGGWYLKITKDKNGEVKVVYSDNKESSSVLESTKRDYPFYDVKYKKYGVPLPKISIRAFYPDYNVIVFDAFKDKRGYKVFVNGSWKYIRLGKDLIYKTWNEHLINDVYIVSESKNPLYEKNNLKSKVLADKNTYSYKVVKVEREWLEVECLKECEGCPHDKKKLKGWVKWREGSKILIDLYYSC